jgi:hypothetical protein
LYSSKISSSRIIANSINLSSKLGIQDGGQLQLLLGSKGTLGRSGVLGF